MTERLVQCFILNKVDKYFINKGMVFLLPVSYTFL
jgi:hypothetical protein